MRLDFEIEIRSNRFAEIADRAHDLLDKAVRKCAFDVEARAKALTPVDTGALRASIYVSAGRQSTFGLARASAQSKNPNAEFFEETRPEQDLEAIVAVGVEYGVYVEFGTMRMPARPYFHPALEAVRPRFERAIRAALEGNAV